MMNSDDFFDVLSALKETKGNNNKVKTLGKYKDDPFVVKMFELAYDPFITFGLDRKVDLPEEGDEVFGERTMAILDQMIERTLTGNAMLSTVTEHLRSLTYKSRALFNLIIKKDFSCGVGIALAKQALPTLNIRSFSLQLAEPLRKAKKFKNKNYLKFPKIIEPKLDGIRAVVVINFKARTANFYTRSGRDITSFNLVKEYLLTFRNNSKDTVFKVSDIFVLDGELVDESNNFNRTISAARKKNAQAERMIYHIFDGLPFDEFLAGRSTKTLLQRRQLIIKKFNLQNETGLLKLVPQKLVKSLDESLQIYEEFLSQGYEGAMLKDIDSYYECTRNYNWIKLKESNTEEGVIVGAYLGVAGTKNENKLGGIEVKISTGEITRVGGGYKETTEYDERQILWDMYLEGSLVGRIVEIEFQHLTEYGKARHANFVKLRDLDGDLT